MIIKEVTFKDFVDAFQVAGRANQFTDDGLQALYDTLNELSDNIGEPLELDVIGLCCEYTEYADFEAFKTDYPNIETLEDYTTVIPFGGKGSFLMVNF